MSSLAICRHLNLKYVVSLHTFFFPISLNKSILPHPKRKGSLSFWNINLYICFVYKSEFSSEMRRIHEEFHLRLNVQLNAIFFWISFLLFLKNNDQNQSWFANQVCSSWSNNHSHSRVHCLFCLLFVIYSILFADSICILGNSGSSALLEAVS